MAGAWKSSRSDRLLLGAVLGGGYAASALFSAMLGGPLSQGALSTAAGFLAAALILLPGAWRLAAIAVCLVAQAAVGEATGASPFRSAAVFLVNGAEASLAAFLAARYCGAQARRLSLRRLTLIVLAAVTPAAVVGGALGALAAVGPTAGFASAWTDLALAGGLGMAIVLPAVLLLARTGQYREFQRGRLETVSLLVMLSALTAVVYEKSAFPLSFSIFPLLTLVAFRLGPPGAAVAGFLVGMIALPLTMLGHGPAMFTAGLDIGERVRLTQLFVGAALFTGVTTAVALADQARLRRLLFARDRAARLAGVRAREAEHTAALALKLSRRPRIVKAA